MLDEKIQDNKLQILGKLTASLIHEIRNPLSVVKLNLDYLKMIEEELSSEAKESVDFCQDALGRIQYLVDDVITFSRKNQSNSGFCSINEITESAVNIMQHNAEMRNIKIITDLGADIPEGRFDKSKLLQVFLNLLTNAIESCNGTGTVTIRTAREAGLIVWVIADNGVGIRESDKDKIFNDFYTNKEKGTGLGLSVCKMILHEYNAELEFESKIGEGSKFFIRFKPNLMQGEHEIQDINY